MAIFEKGEKMVSSKYNVIISTNGKTYVFNLASQCLIEANNEVIQYISNTENKAVLTEEEERVLHDNGIIVSSHEFEVLRLKSNINSLRYDRSRYGVFLSTTAGCNLNCTYCYQDKRKELNSKGYVTPENWEIMLTHFRTEMQKYNVKQFVVCLFGGEPMYDDKMCQQIIRDLRKLESDIESLSVQMVLITNGTLFTEDNVEFYLKNVENIQITLDGIKEIHDQFRVYANGSGSFDKIVDGLGLICKYNICEDPCEVCIRVNVNEKTVEKARDLIDFIVEKNLQKGITTISFHEIFSTQGDIIESGGESESPDLVLANKICQLNFYVLSKGIKVFKELAGPCIAKMATGYAIDENLNIYGCPGIIYSEVHGKLQENGEISVNSKDWYSYYLDDPDCIDKCKYAPICYGGCNWARGKKEKECKREVFDATIVQKLQAYIMSKYT
ncbi:MAG: radical SAM/SPASM domain-containing protein [Hungatella sp.]|nr:radical SAM protein [Hungatella effluvii]